MRCLVVAALAVCVGARAAEAHQTSVKYLDVTAGGGRVELALRFAPGDVVEPMRLPADARPSAEVAAREPAVAPYVARWVAVTARGAPCAASAPAARPDEDGKLVVVEWTAQCAADDAVVLDLRPFFAIDPRHVAMVHVETGDREPTDVVVRAGQPTLALELGAPAAARIRAGFTAALAPEHVGLAIALVIACVCAAGRLRPLGEAARWTAVVLGAFAAGALAATIWSAAGWVALPPRLYAVLGALSAAYVGIDNLFAPPPRRRIALALAFGAVHGLGLAAAAPRDLAGLAAFVAGAGLALAALGLIALPVGVLAARQLGVRRFARFVVPAVAIAAILAGVSTLGR